MRKLLLLTAAFATFTLNAAAQDDYELRVLTFEDADYRGTGSMQSTGKDNWSSLIDDPQYSGDQLYNANGYAGVNIYYWADENNTMLAHEFPLNWAMYNYAGGGHAISHYNSGETTTYGGFNYQLTVYRKDVAGMAYNYGGHNESNNFCVHYGYHDNSGFSADNLPALYFYDGVARVIDHMYVNNTCYALNCFVNGNSLTGNIGPDDWVKIVATGYDADGKEVAGKAEIYLCNGPEDIVTDWTKFDLSVLGAVTRVEFNVTGSNDNGYGFSQPAYFAYDDVAVRFPKEATGISKTPAASGDAAAYNLAGQRVGRDYKGVVIVNGKKMLRK